MELKLVKFLTSRGGYSIGETAGFKPAVAAMMIADGSVEEVISPGIAEDKQQRPQLKNERYNTKSG